MKKIPSEIARVNVFVAVRGNNAAERETPTQEKNYGTYKNLKFH